MEHLSSDERRLGEKKLCAHGWEITDEGYFTLDAHALYPSQCSKGNVWSLSRIDPSWWTFQTDKGTVQSVFFDDMVKQALFTQTLHKERERKSDDKKKLCVLA